MISFKVAIAIVLAFFVGLIFGSVLVYSVLSGAEATKFKEAFDDHVDTYANAMTIIYGLKNTYSILENEIESVEGVKTEDDEEFEVNEHYIEGIIYAMDVMKENINNS